MKRKVIVINKVKLFKRFLKENGIYATYMKYVTPKEGMQKFIKNTAAHNLLDTTWINDEWKNSIKLRSIFITNSLKWISYLLYEINKTEYIKLFRRFLNERGLLKLYESKFSPQYANGKNTFIKSLPFEIYKWEDLPPNYFINAAFPIEYDDAEQVKLWGNLNARWLEKLSYERTKINVIYEV